MFHSSKTVITMHSSAIQLYMKYNYLVGHISLPLCSNHIFLVHYF